MGGKPSDIVDTNEVLRTVDNTKRFIGRYWEDPVVGNLAGDLTYGLGQDSEHRPVIKLQVAGQDRELYAEEIAALILRQVQEDASA